MPVYTSVFVYTTASVTSATPRPDTALPQELLVRPLVLKTELKFKLALLTLYELRAALAT